MSKRKVLLLEPPYRNKYPPMGLMKLATYFKSCSDDVYFFKGDLKKFAADLLCDEYLLEINDSKLLKYRSNLLNYIRTGKRVNIDAINNFCDSENEKHLLTFRKRFKDEDFPQFDIVGVTTLFTFYWKQTISTINYAKKFLKYDGRILVGGIASTILPQQILAETGVNPIVGLLNKPGAIDQDNELIIDELPLDYSILDEIDYKYPANDAYFSYMTRGCPNKCAFCAVPTLEPDFCNYIGIEEQIKEVDKTYGAKKDLLLMDNNVFASNCFDKIIDEIKKFGFQKGATYTSPNEYEVTFNNIVSSLNEQINVRGYIIKMIKIYDEIADKLPEHEQADFYLKREEFRLLYPTLATREKIIEFNEIAEPLFMRNFKPSTRMRFVDFNQGVDARLITDEKMKKMSEIAIRPLRIAFDHYGMKDIYIEAIRTAARHGIKDLSNYLLYNFNDKPEHLYERMKINIDLCEELGISIYSFPMKYHPIDDIRYFNNRNYIGKHWNRKFIRAIQAVLNATKGKVGRGKAFFEEAFGCDVNEFMKILWMPETFIIYRRKYDAALRERLSSKYGKHIDGENDLTNEWWIKFNALNEKQLKELKTIVSKNNFDNENCNSTDSFVSEVLKYYKIKRP